jgi:Beta/Gamma crystallin
MRGQTIIGGVIGAIAILAAAGADAQPRWGRPSLPRDGACFYRDKNFHGDYFCTDAGQDVAVMPNGMNDQITSIRTFGNVQVTIYKDGRFRGRSSELRGDVRNVGDEWNDGISSIRVRRASGRDRDSDRDRDHDRDRDRDRDRDHDRDRDRDGDHDRAPRWTDQQAEAMVARAYRSLLGREPDPAARSWVDQVKSHNWSEQQLQDEIRKSREYREKHPR